MSTWTDLHSLIVRGSPDCVTLTACFRAAVRWIPADLAAITWRIETANGPVDLRTVGVAPVAQTVAVVTLVGRRRIDRLRLTAACRLAGGEPFRIVALAAAGPGGGARFTPSPACGWTPSRERLYEIDRIAA